MTIIVSLRFSPFFFRTTLLSKKKRKKIFMITAHTTEILDVLAIAKEHDYETILAESEKFEPMDVNSLVTILITHYHNNTRGNIICIYDLAQKVSVKHSYMHPELSKLTEALFLFDDLLFHFKKEEQILFPNIIRLMKKAAVVEASTYTKFGLVKELVLFMQKENYAIIRKLMVLRELTNNYMIPGDACSYYRSLFERMKEFEKCLLLYIHLENGNLFPKAIHMEEGFTKHFIKRKLETNSMFLKKTY